MRKIKNEWSKQAVVMLVSERAPTCIKQSELVRAQRQGEDTSSRQERFSITVFHSKRVSTWTYEDTEHTQTECGEDTQGKQRNWEDNETKVGGGGRAQENQTQKGQKGKH